MDSYKPELVEQVVDQMRRSRSVLVITGAGLSADSGLPTYRGIGGLYNRDQTEDGMAIEDVLSGHTIRSNPELCWKYLDEILKAARGAEPNRGHQVIAEMEEHFERFWVLTQNIDGFHGQAGSKNLIEIHGNIHQLLCPACGARREFTEYEEITIPPACESCDNIMRPDVVFFGELLPEHHVATLSSQLEQGFDLVLSVGTTSAFPYIAGPVVQAKQQGKVSVEINPGKSEVSHLVDIKLAAGAAQALDDVWKHFLES